MNLYLFPAPADNHGGYDIAVKDAYDRLQPKDTDVVVWACLSKPQCAKNNDYVVYYKPFKSFHTIKKLCSGYLNNEFSAKDLRFLKGKDFDEIHCDDVIYYRAVRKLFPNKRIIVRFHNVFARIFERVYMLRLNTDWRFYGKMFLSRNLERMIMNDPFVFKIFLTQEDANYYHLVTGNSDYSVWSMKIEQKAFEYGKINQIVWFGGIEGHKKSSVEWFLKSIWPYIRRQFPNIEFHLYGLFSENYTDKSQNIIGHGFYGEDKFPFLDSGLYINPDVMGGGIKIKVSSYLKNGVRFISTPFGFEGYDKKFIDNYQCYVIPCQDWASELINIIRKYQQQ